MLLQGIDVIRLRDRNELDGCQRADDLGGTLSVGNAEAHHGRAGDGEVSEATSVNPTAACSRSTGILAAICGKSARDGLVLTEAQLVALEKAKTEKDEQHLAAGHRMHAHHRRNQGCPLLRQLLGVKRKCRKRDQFDAPDPKPTSIEC